MPKKPYCIQLRDQEYLTLRQYVKDRGTSARVINRARLLLWADDQISDEAIAEILGLGTATVHRVRKHYYEGGLEKALHEKPRSGAPPKVDGRVEAMLTMLACAEPPEGYGRWTLQLLADKLVALEGVDSISLPTVRTILKKRTQTLVSQTLVHRENHWGLSLAYGRCHISV
jgi:transposase